MNGKGRGQEQWQSWGRSPNPHLVAHAGPDPFLKALDGSESPMSWAPHAKASPSQRPPLQLLVARVTL